MPFSQLCRKLTVLTVALPMPRTWLGNMAKLGCRWHFVPKLKVVPVLTNRYICQALPSKTGGFENDAREEEGA